MNDATLEAANNLAQTVNTWPIITAAIVLIGVALLVTAVVIVYGSKFIIRMAEINSKTTEEQQRRIRALETDRDNTEKQLSAAVASLERVVSGLLGSVTTMASNVGDMYSKGSQPVQTLIKGFNDLSKAIDDLKREQCDNQGQILEVLRDIQKQLNAKIEDAVHDTGEVEVVAEGS